MNEADPLAQLRDIHVPQTVDWWPFALGWWLLILLSVAVVIAACGWALYRYRANAYRRSARAELLLLYLNWQQNGDNLAYLQAANNILKRTAILGYKKSAVQGLSGNQWCEFLDQHWHKPHDPGFKQSPFATALYSDAEPATDITSQHTLADSWLREHRGEKC